MTFGRQLVEESPDHVDHQVALGGALSNLANKLDAQRRYREAIEALEEAIAIQRPAYEADHGMAKNYLIIHYSNLCEILANCEDLSLRDVPRAIQLGLAAVDLDPDSPIPNIHLGKAFYRNAEPDKAKPYLLKAVETMKHDPGRCFILSATYSSLQDWPKAQQWYDEGCARLEASPSKHDDDLSWQQEAEELLQTKDAAQPVPDSEDDRPFNDDSQ